MVYVSKQRKAAIELFAKEGRETKEERLNLSLVLSQSDDPVIRSYAEKLRDPTDRMSRCTAVNLMIQDGLSLKRICAEYKSIKEAEGTMRMFNRIPDFMENLIVDAETEVVKCLECDGEGIIDGKTCKNCRGKGTERIKQEVDRIRTVLETANLIGKAKVGNQVNILNQLGGHEEVEDLYDSLNPIIEGNKQ